jgi:gamma-glutamyltranspeptidase
MAKEFHYRRGMVTSPHRLASQAGVAVLRDGGSAVEAAVASAAALAVLYPHMTGLGGDSFWLISQPGKAPIAIDACGAAGLRVSPNSFHRRGLKDIPQRGPFSAITVAGSISGWQKALEQCAQAEPPLPLQRLLRDAVQLAEAGIVITKDQAEATRRKRDALEGEFGFAEAYLPSGTVAEEGHILKQPALASTFRLLATDGLDSFYRGSLAKAVINDLMRAGSPLQLADLARHQALVREPLSVGVRDARLFNCPPPTQGLTSLMVLALFDRLHVTEGNGFDHIHGIVEATKQAFLVRDHEIGDPGHMRCVAADFLSSDLLDELATRIHRRTALRWQSPPAEGDTVWVGAADGAGCTVSMIQSLYFEYGSGVVLPETGIVWQNRGCSFSLHGNGPNLLRPGSKPLHTLNPAMARFVDGREMVYGTMGGDGQPQTQAAVFSRYAWFGMDLQEAVSAPRWLLGRTWGEQSVSLKLENRFREALSSELAAAGHAVELTEAFTSMMGHAGALVRHPDGLMEAAADPRSDGSAEGY